MNPETTKQPPQAVGPHEQATPSFRHILVCLDRSKTAEAALPLAVHFAQLDDARITLLHVLETPEEASDIRATDAIAWDIERHEAKGYLARVAEQVAERGVSPDLRVAEGTAPSQVISLAKVLDVDLTVLSSHGIGGEGAWPLGSTAQKILALARGALLVVPSSPRESSPTIPLRRIFVPLDGSVRSESVLPTAVRLARAEGAEIVIAHVVSDPIRTEVLSTEEDLTLARELSDRLNSRAQAYTDQVRARLNDEGPRGARARAVVGRSTDHRAGLMALAVGERADLVLLSAHGAVCDARRPFGSVTAYFMAHSTVPVLVIQDLRDGPHSTLVPTTRPPPRSLDVDPPRN
jgi:nucleotide-binding universal stress UspA family protein